MKTVAAGVSRSNFLLPLPVRNERGEGWGEGPDRLIDWPSSPLPSPPSKRGEGARDAVVSHSTIFLFLALILCFSMVSGTALAQPLQLPKLQPPHEEIGPSLWERHGLQIVIASVVFAGLVAMFIGWLRRSKPVVVIPPEVLARRDLETLRGSAENGALVVQVSRIVRRYVISVFTLPPEELTTSELIQALSAHSQTDRGLVTAIGEFLRRSDELKFAPALLPPQAGIVTRAAELVETIEKHRQQLPKDAPPQGGGVPPIIS